jgi:hypothetical protein
MLNPLSKMLKSGHEQFCIHVDASLLLCIREEFGLCSLTREYLGGWNIVDNGMHVADYCHVVCVTIDGVWIGE